MTLSPDTSISWPWIPVGGKFFVVKNGITELTSQSARLVIDMVLKMHCDTTAKSINVSANAVDVADNLTTALDLQKLPINDHTRARCANGSYFKNDIH
jgi:hypothetical protein